MQERNVDRQTPAAKEARHVRQENGNIRCTTGVDRFASGLSREESSVMKSAGEALRDIRRSAIDVEVNKLHVLEGSVSVGFAAPSQRIDQFLGKCVRSVDKDALVGLNGKYRLVGTNKHEICAFRSAGYLLVLPYETNRPLPLSRTAEKSPERI
jgi:hypothetical protein